MNTYTKERRKAAAPTQYESCLLDLADKQRV
jgi:hypothetical protein